MNNYYDNKYCLYKGPLVGMEMYICYITSWHFDSPSFPQKYKFNVNPLYARLNYKYIKHYSRYSKNTDIFNKMIEDAISDIRKSKILFINTRPVIIKEKDIFTYVMSNDMIYVGK